MSEQLENVNSSVLSKRKKRPAVQHQASLAALGKIRGPYWGSWSPGCTVRGVLSPNNPCPHLLEIIVKKQVCVCACMRVHIVHGCLCVGREVEVSLFAYFLHIPLETSKPSCLSNWRSGPSYLSFCLGKAVAGMERERGFASDRWGMALIYFITLACLVSLGLNFVSCATGVGFETRCLDSFPGRTCWPPLGHVVSSQTPLSAPSGHASAVANCLIPGQTLPWSAHIQLWKILEI